jgi:hypothetical protein
MHNLICRAIGHKRSLARVRRTPEGLHSSCKVCGAKLVRQQSGKWFLKSASETSPEELGEHVIFKPTGTSIWLKSAGQ